MDHTLLSCILYSFLLKSGYFEYLCYHAHLLSLVWVFAALWTSAHQAVLSMGFFKQEYWSGLPFPPPGVLPTEEPNSHLLHCGLILYCWVIGEYYRWQLWNSNPPPLRPSCLLLLLSFCLLSDFLKYQDSGAFSWLRFFLATVNFQLVFRGLKKLILTHFPSLFTALWRHWLLGFSTLTFLLEFLADMLYLYFPNNFTSWLLILLIIYPLMNWKFKKIKSSPTMVKYFYCEEKKESTTIVLK